MLKKAPGAPRIRDTGRAGGWWARVLGPCGQPVGWDGAGAATRGPPSASVFIRHLLAEYIPKPGAVKQSWGLGIAVHLSQFLYVLMHECKSQMQDHCGEALEIGCVANRLLFSWFSLYQNALTRHISKTISSICRNSRHPRPSDFPDLMLR